MLDELKEANEYVVSKIEEKDPLILEMETFAIENNVPMLQKKLLSTLNF